MAYKNITFRIEETEKNTLETDFLQAATAMRLIVDPHSRLRKLTMREMTGYFTRQELTALIDSQNGVLLTPDFIYNKAFLLAQLEDFESLEHGIMRHGANAQKLFKKIAHLAHAQVYFLMLDISVFWNTTGDLNQYLDSYVS